MLEGRVIIPRDVFVTVCVEHQKLSELLLDVAKHLHRESGFLPPNSTVLDAAVAANAQLGLIESILKTIIDEFPEPEAPTGGGGTPGPTSGGECHAQ